jgi:hypothetical protein
LITCPKFHFIILFLTEAETQSRSKALNGALLADFQSPHLIHAASSSSTSSSSIASAVTNNANAHTFDNRQSSSHSSGTAAAGSSNRVASVQLISFSSSSSSSAPSSLVASSASSPSSTTSALKPSISGTTSHSVGSSAVRPPREVAFAEPDLHHHRTPLHRHEQPQHSEQQQQNQQSLHGLQPPNSHQRQQLDATFAGGEIDYSSPCALTQPIAIDESMSKFFVSPVCQ